MTLIKEISRSSSITYKYKYFFYKEIYPFKQSMDLLIINQEYKMQVKVFKVIGDWSWYFQHANRVSIVIGEE